MSIRLLTIFSARKYGGQRDVPNGLFLSKILYYSILHEYCDFSVSRHPYFCEKGGRGRAFCGPVAGVMKKKFEIFTAVAQRVAVVMEKKVKKNFGGLKNGRIFAPAFERGRRPSGGAAGEWGGERSLKQWDQRDSVCRSVR